MNLIHLKQRSRYFRDNRKNVIIRSKLVERELNIRSQNNEEYCTDISLDCYYKCRYAMVYKDYSTDKLNKEYETLQQFYTEYTNYINENGRKILKLRGNKWKF